MTTSKDCIKQISGHTNEFEYDQTDTLQFVIYKAPRFQERDINVCFDLGIVEVLSEDGTAVTERHVIEIILHPLPLSPTTGVSGTVE